MLPGELAPMQYAQAVEDLYRVAVSLTTNLPAAVKSIRVAL
jgi:hypothetical protein